MRRAACLAAMLVLPALAQEKAESFSTRFAIVTEAAMPYYRLSVPLQAYLASAHGDLRDLRVFNAAGQPVPYALLAASGSTEESVQRHEPRWFPVRASLAGQHGKPDGDNALNVVVKQAGDGTLVEINSNRGPSTGPAAKPDAAPLRGYVLDASRITDRLAVRALDLDWDKAGGDFQLLDVESSDDLQHWNSVATGVQLVRLDYNGARIENRRIELHGFRDRYLRLIWREPASAPMLTSVELEQSRSRYQSAALTWSAPIAASVPDANIKPGEYRFHLAQPLPVVRLRLELPAGNQLLPLEVLSLGRERRQWHSLANTVAYRIMSKGREWTNTEIPLSGDPLQDFVLRVDPRRNPLPQGPQLAFALQPAQIVFLASGEAPYTLAVGNQEAKDASLAPATLVPGFGNPDSPEIANARIETSNAAPAAGTPAVVPVPAPERDWKKMALWTVLVLGVVGMAAMAWQLLRQMNKPGDGR